jgi:hypothetical protein
MRLPVLRFLWFPLCHQRVPQLFGPDQGQGLGRGQRPQIEAPAEVHARVRRLPRTGIDLTNLHFGRTLSDHLKNIFRPSHEQCF